MDKKNTKMKKFNPLRGVLDGLRSTVSAPPKGDVIDIEETLRSDHFQISKTVRHGFPYQPYSMAYDPVQNLLAIGTKTGSLRIFGRPGVDCHVRHEGDPAILQILFLVNEGALVTVCADDNLHLWTLRQKRPTIVHSLKFQRERITYCHLPFQSKWLYIGTERGNVHIVNIESFGLSGYVINWNKAIELSRKTHPGQVVHLSDNPVDPNKMLIGFESGAIVLWDLKSKTAEFRYSSQDGVVLQGLRSVSWHHEGKQFMCSHADGSLATWNYKLPQKPVSVIMPHAKIGKDGKPEPCKPITKVEWKSVRNGEPYVIFSGGMPYDKASRTPSLTVMHAKNTTVLEMEHNVVDFLTLCSTPWNSDFQDPYGIVVLLQNDLVVVDLTSPGYPCFENPYPMDIHESPVTACQYYADCPTDLIPAFYSVGSKQKRTGFSEKEWPVRGGEWGTTTCSYPEMMLTGHADGSVKFWDASAVTLLVLYKLKTAKVFERSKCRAPDPDDDPFAIQHLQLCTESRLLVVAGLTHIILFRFSKTENSIDPPVLEINIIYEIYDDLDSPEVEYPPHPPDSRESRKPIGSSGPSGSVGSYGSSTSDGKENITCVRVKSGPRRWAPGYHPDLCCILTWIDGEPPPMITSCQVNSRYGLLAFGNECGIAVVDIVQKTCLLNMGTPDLYGSLDPYSRAPRSPKSKAQRDRPQGLEGLSQSLTQAVEDCKSPTTDQCEPSSFPSPLASGPSSPQHRPPPPLQCISEDDTITEEGWVKCTLEEEEEEEEGSSDITEEGQEALDELDTHNRASSVFDEVDCMNPPPLSDPTLRDTNHNTAASSEAKVANDSSNTTASKRPLGVSKSVPLISNSHHAHRRLHLGVRSGYPEQCTVNPNGGEQCADDEPGGVESESRTAEGGPVPPPRRRKKSLFKTRHKPKDQDQEEEEQDSETPTSPTPDIACIRPFRSESDMHSDELQALANAVAAEEAQTLTALANAAYASAGVMATDGKEGSSSDPAAVGPPVAKSKTGASFIRRLSTKMKIIVKRTNHEEEECEESRSSRRSKLDEKFEMLDLTSDEDVRLPVTRKVTYYSHVVTADKADGSFSRSRSSSMSSLENITKEAISSLVFADSYTRKTDSFTCPCLWVGTSLGSVLVVVLNLPPEGEQRMTQPVIVSPSGTIFRLRGAILTMSFLDCNGVLIPAITDPWNDGSRDQSPGRGSEKKYNRQQSVSSNKSRMSPTSSTEQPTDRQFAIICSEKHARVMSLPSQTCAYKVKITETSVVANAEVVSIKDSVCLACYIANGHVMTFSLPSLKPLLDVDYLPLTDVRIAKTFSFSSNGHALYFCSPTEVQKVTLSAEVGESLNEMLGDLFLPTETPEAPKQSFFKNLFTGGPSVLDREDLFGENSGKASKGVARYTPGMASTQAQAGQATSAIAIAHKAALERGEKLRETEEATERMRANAEQFSSLTHQLMAKQRDRKWYQI